MADTDAPPVLHRGIGTPAKCRSCPARIIFASTQSSSKIAPWEEDPDGEWIAENGSMRHVGKPDAPSRQLELGAPPTEPGPTRFTSHFARCPGADKHRRPR